MPCRVPEFLRDHAGLLHARRFSVIPEARPFQRGAATPRTWADAWKAHWLHRGPCFEARYMRPRVHPHSRRTLLSSRINGDSPSLLSVPRYDHSEFGSGRFSQTVLGLSHVQPLAEGRRCCVRASHPQPLGRSFGDL